MQTFFEIASGIVAITIILVEIAIHRRPRAWQQPSPRQAELDAKLQHPDRLRQLIKETKKIQAIKLYREETGANLQEAKAAVERMAAGTNEPLPQERSAKTGPGLIDPEKLQALIREGRKIEAIKYIRQQRGVGLKEAKEAVDWLEANLNSQ